MPHFVPPLPRRLPGKDALPIKVEKGTTHRAIAAQYAPDYDRDNTFGQPDEKDARGSR